MLLDARIIIIPVNDLERARQWYSDVLRFGPTCISHNWVGFNGGGYEIRLVLKRGRRTGLAGSPLIYWRVWNIEDALRRLLQTGAKPHTPVCADKNIGLCASVVDPFANVIGLVQETAACSPCFNRSSDDDLHSLVAAG